MLMNVNRPRETYSLRANSVETGGIERKDSDPPHYCSVYFLEGGFLNLNRRWRRRSAR